MFQNKSDIAVIRTSFRIHYIALLLPGEADNLGFMKFRIWAKESNNGELQNSRSFSKLYSGFFVWHIRGFIINYCCVSE